MRFRCKIFLLPSRDLPYTQISVYRCCKLRYIPSLLRCRRPGRRPFPFCTHDRSVVRMFTASRTPYGPVDYIFPVIKHVDHFSMFETIEYLQLHLYLSPLSTGISTQHFFLRILMHCMRGCAILFEVPTYLKPIHNRIFFIIASQSSSPFYPTYRSAPPTQKSCVRGALYLICLSRS